MPGPRVYEIDEVNELLPSLEELLVRMDGIRAKVKRVNLRVNALEMIWGEGVQEKDNSDHAEYEHHLAEMKRSQEEFERCTQEVAELGGQIKGLDPPLVDFYGVREGRLIFWCWTRGEEEVTHWHHIDEGFAQRQPV